MAFYKAATYTTSRVILTLYCRLKTTGVTVNINQTTKQYSLRTDFEPYRSAHDDFNCNATIIRDLYRSRWAH